MNNNNSNHKKKNKGPKRLLFIKQLMEMRGINYVLLAKRMGITPQAVREAIKGKDNCSLVALEGYAKALDVQITPRFDFSYNNLQKPRYIVEGDFQMDTLPETPLPGFVTKSIRDAGRLSFLGEFLASTGNTMAEITTKTGIPKETYYSYFKRDDIAVDRLYCIAEAYNTKVIWKITDLLK